MATTASGKWVDNGVGTSMKDRWFYSGELASTDGYVELEFGFSANDLIIMNLGTNKLAFQWPGQKGTPKDGGIVPGKGSDSAYQLKFRNANKTSILVRSETAGSSSAFAVMAIG